MLRRILSAFLAASVIAPLVGAEFSLAPVFADHAVLQRDRVLPVWGTARRGETVTVSFLGQSVSTKANDEGNWRVDLSPVPAHPYPTELVVKGRKTITVRDVVVGDVWICAGQSNMEWPVSMNDQAASVAAAASHPLIRHFKAERQTSNDRPAPQTPGQWIVCAPETVGAFTAVGYFFACEIQRSAGVPVGLVNITWGGTPIETWLPPSAIDAVKPLDPGRWLQSAVSGRPTQTGVIWNGMVAPVVPLAVLGVLWYQGEENAGRAAEYRQQFPAMIAGWRDAWARGARPPAGDSTTGASATPAVGQLPFFFVQLPNFANGNPAGTDWALLREAQAAALSLPATGMAVAIDEGVGNDIHPPRKQEVARRLALLARARVYRQGIDAAGPTYLSHTLEGNGSIRIHFSNAEIGLISRATRLHGFFVAGADRVFRPAEAAIEGESVLVRSPNVAAPLAARYAFANDPQPEPSLYNGAGLPAVPFRTDQW
jgi:sialate O-acetylesterase